MSFASLTFGGPAWSQPDDPVTKAARARFNEGVEFYDHGQYDMARASFLQAYSLKKHPAVLLNLAQSCLKSNHPLEAAKYFQQYLRESTTATAAQKADAESGLVEARGKIGRIEIVAPAGTEIFIENDRIGVAPLSEPVDVEPGAHTVTGKKDGQTENAKVNVNPGEKKQTKLFDKSAPPPPPPPTGSTTAPPPPPPPTGSVTPPPPPPPENPPQEKKSIFGPPLILAIAGGGLAVVGFGMGLTFFILKNDAQSAADANEKAIRDAVDSYNSKPPGSTSPIQAKGICSNLPAPPAPSFKGACDTYKSNIDKTNTNATVANIGLVAGIVGAAAAIGGGVWFVVSQPKKSGEWKAPVVTPYYSTEQSGVVVSGRF